MNCDTSTKNLIHLQADGCAGLIPLRCCALMGLRWGTFARFRALYALNWVRVHAALRRKTPSRFLGYALLAGWNPCEVNKNARGSEPLAFMFKGGSSGVRTLGLGIKSPLLCQLSP